MIFRILEDQLAENARQSKAADLRFMQLALTLGRRGQGRTWPNPAVGAVVVNDGIIVGRGWTQAGGRPHAEPEALAARRRGRARRYPLRDIGAVLAFRPLATLRRRRHCRRHCARGVGGRGPEPGSCRAGPCKVARGWDRCRRRALLRGSGARPRRPFPPHQGSPPASAAQARGVRRRHDRRRRPQAGRDHGRGGADAGAYAARAMRRHPGRHRHGAGG